jgi:hypothetical protein
VQITRPNTRKSLILGCEFPDGCVAWLSDRVSPDSASRSAAPVIALEIESHEQLGRQTGTTAAPYAQVKLLATLLLLE